MTSLMLTGNQRGLIYVGRMIPTQGKVEKVQPVEKVDNRFQYYYNTYLKREDMIMKKASEMNFKEVLDTAKKLLDETLEGTTEMDRVKKEIISMGQTINFLRNDLPKVMPSSRRSPMFAKLARELDVIRTEMIEFVHDEQVKYQKELHKNIVAGRSLECSNCHNIVGFNIAEWWSYDKKCPICGSKITEE